MQEWFVTAKPRDAFVGGALHSIFWSTVHTVRAAPWGPNCILQRYPRLAGSGAAKGAPPADILLYSKAGCEPNPQLAMPRRVSVQGCMRLFSIARAPLAISR